MTYQEIVSAIGHLTIEERLQLIEQLAHSLRAEVVATPRGSSAERLRGILKTEGPAPTDEEVREMITAYLIEKHS